MLHSVKRLAVYVTALGVLALGGSALADAATSSSSSPTTSTAAKPQAPPNFPAHGTSAHEDAEKAVTGKSATKAQAAAVKSVGGGTAGAVTTDCSGSGYEVTVTKSDGTKVEVHLDSSYSVIQGPGGHRGPGGPGGPPPPYGG
jgi:hypothetical protein